MPNGTAEDRPVVEIDAAYQFRLGLNPDAMYGGAPLWHGWAVHDAFFAGIDYERASVLLEIDRLIGRLNQKAAIEAIQKICHISIPQSVEYCDRTDNFNQTDTKRGMGSTFYARWHHRRSEFPQRE
jgi:hypothetical protein